ncbi:hypothetical protein BDK51DRAFT_46633 [Blyttiomyces helicus]|uniref:Glyoxal oxidase N-terminal domain-containing protein n=1 Tax=Blyttiomyces helicus TaxID=388810 RepID=A0A4P9WJ02_9FUNG|nr:hypothetical protein BDK51DRAFT_46633 [Blyttiomyces helicus]|eukprot:RKO90566.1 hypothetical protein BDK51DRAFT_46633 [Blyttiomyces helicus]
MPNTLDHIFTIIDDQVFIYDYINNQNVTTLPFLPNPRTFPSSASTVLLPLKASENYRPEVMVCGGSSGDAPNPLALDDCGRIHPLDTEPEWTFEKLPDGPRTMGDAILLPDGTVFITNGARLGSGGGVMADDPAFTPLIYNPDAAVGERFTIMPATTIPRLYHSVAALLPTGETSAEPRGARNMVLVAVRLMKGATKKSTAVRARGRRGFGANLYELRYRAGDNSFLIVGIRIHMGREDPLSPCNYRLITLFNEEKGGKRKSPHFYRK